MSTEISTQTQARGLALQSFADAMKFGETVANSEFAPKDFRGKAASCMLAIQCGAEIGLAPLQALQSIAVVNGRPAVYGDAALAIVKASPICEYVIEAIDGEGEQMVATCTAKRRGYPQPTVVRFSVADAKKAGLWGKAGPWTQYPRRMLQMRARGFALRDCFPDALRGLVSVEEAQDYSAATPQHEPSPAGGAYAQSVTAVHAVQPAKAAAATEADIQKARKAINGTTDLGKLGDFLATVNERHDAGFYTLEQANDLRNLIDTKIEWLNSNAEVTA